MEKRHRKYFFFWDNYDADDLEYINNWVTRKNIRYAIVCYDELQNLSGFVSFVNGILWTSFWKKYCLQANILPTTVSNESGRQTCLENKTILYEIGNLNEKISREGNRRYYFVWENYKIEELERLCFWFRKKNVLYAIISTDEEKMIFKGYVRFKNKISSKSFKRKYCLYKASIKVVESGDLENKGKLVDDGNSIIEFGKLSRRRKRNDL